MWNHMAAHETAGLGQGNTGGWVLQREGGRREERVRGEG